MLVVTICIKSPYSAKAQPTAKVLVAKEKRRGAHVEQPDMNNVGITAKIPLPLTAPNLFLIL